MSGMVRGGITDAKTPNPDVSSVAMVEVFHSPRNHMRLSRLEANSMQFFYESTDEQYIKKCKENGALPGGKAPLVLVERQCGQVDCRILGGR